MTTVQFLGLGIFVFLVFYLVFCLLVDIFAVFSALNWQIKITFIFVFILFIQFYFYLFLFIIYIYLFYIVFLFTYFYFILFYLLLFFILFLAQFFIIFLPMSSVSKGRMTDKTARLEDAGHDRTVSVKVWHSFVRLCTVSHVQRFRFGRQFASFPDTFSS